MLITVAPNSPEWEAMRNDGIGASDAGSIWGVGFHPLDEMVRRKALKIPTLANFKMRYGHYAEPSICTYAHHRLIQLGFNITEYTEANGIFVHDTHDYIRSTPDRTGSYAIGNDDHHFVFDSKNSGAGMSWSFKKRPQLKLGYWIQSQQQMMTTNKEQAFMATNFANDRFVIWHIDADPVFQAAHTTLCQMTWNVISTYDPERPSAMVDVCDSIRTLAASQTLLLDQGFRTTCAIISDEE